MNKILIVDDDDMVRLAVSENLKDNGLVPVEASTGQEAIDLFRGEEPVSVILDLKMPGMDGLATMRELKKINPSVPVIINTAYGDIPTAVEAIKLGAYDFIIKPPDFDRLVLTLKRAAEKFELDKKVERLEDDVETSLEYLFGKSDAMKKVIHQIQRISRSDFSLIIQGETGTGKSFLARTVHNLSRRAKAPFVAVDIGAIPETLIESELFGYEKGAFTGAEKKKKGYFEMADGGTLLIDELQNLSPYVQSKLLMAIEEKKIMPLGSTKPLHTDVRIIGATNKDIIRSVKEDNAFREDLFYRLSEFIINLPPLRERPEDIPFLAEKFFRDVSEDLDKQLNSISPDALSLLTGYAWPGNIRELKNVVRRSVLLSDEHTIKPEHIEFLNSTGDTPPAKRGYPAHEEQQGLNLRELEKMAIQKTLKHTKGNKTKAAAILDIDYTTLLRKIKRHGI